MSDAYTQQQHLSTHVSRHADDMASRVSTATTAVSAHRPPWTWHGGSPQILAPVEGLEA
jgi:hypothetical protein